MPEAAVALALNRVRSIEQHKSSYAGLSSTTISMLAYVHLRNIHGSTGAGRVARQLIEHLAKRSDVDIRVLADPADYASVVPRVGPPWDQFEYRFFASETSRQQAKWFFLDRPRAEQFWPEAQIVYCTAESYVPVRKARLAVTLHDAAYFEDDAHLKNARFASQKLKWSLLYRKLASKADLFHTVSHFSADRLSHFFPSIRPRIRVVHNAVTPHFFAPVTEAGQAQVESLGLHNRPFLLLPGGLHFRKNAELVLKVWPQLKNIHPELLLAVVNHSHPDYVAKSKQFGADFRILGFVPDEGLRALYAAAEAVWFPSKYEGFGLPVLEAMACGAPVLTSNSSSLPEIAGEAALFAAPDRPQDHLESLDGLLRDSKLRAELGRSGKNRAALFTWEASAAQLKGYFDGIL
jgi:glycosyltransferase involved in cell wall biosynthesis